MKGEITTRPAVTLDAKEIHYCLWNFAYDQDHSSAISNQSEEQLMDVIDNPNAVRRLFVAERTTAMGSRALAGVADISLTPTFIWSPYPKIHIEGIAVDQMYLEEQVGERLLGEVYGFADTIRPNTPVIMDVALTNDLSLRAIIASGIQGFRNQT